MATTDKPLYAGNASITCTLASLASSATAGRSCLAVDNSSNLYMDALLEIGIKTGSGTLANDKACYIYLFGSADGSHFTGSSAEAVGTDVAVTLDSPTNLRGPFALACPASSTLYVAQIDVALFFGGIMPKKWGFVLQNYTGQALDASACFAQYTGINPQSV